MTGTGRKKSSAALPATAPKLHHLAVALKPSNKFKPNRNTIAVRPYKHRDMTKAEMYEDLRKAVENTK